MARKDVERCWCEESLAESRTELPGVRRRRSRIWMSWGSRHTNTHLSKGERPFRAAPNGGRKVGHGSPGHHGRPTKSSSLPHAGGRDTGSTVRVPIFWICETRVLDQGSVQPRHSLGCREVHGAADSDAAQFRRNCRTKHDVGDELDADTSAQALQSATARSFERSLVDVVGVELSHFRTIAEEGDVYAAMSCVDFDAELAEALGCLPSRGHATSYRTMV